MIQSWKLGLAWLVMSGAIASSANSALAQITPDSTLPNNSRVTPSGNTSIIEGGTRAGSNLFHSFQEFSVPTGSTADFNNALDIQNIITRVTGKSISNIDGLIKANGTANLFLINPNGIIFGPNASLNIGGSFLASTASSLKFADGKEFSATAPQTTPLLTISVPIGLQYGVNPGKILVQGNGQGLRTTPDFIDTTFGLRVQPNQTLALVGGDVVLEGGTLKTAGGRIELGSVAQEGLVSLTPSSKGFALGYDAVPSFGNIQLLQQAAVDASGSGSGDIQVIGRRVTLSNGSQIETSSLGADKGGAMVVMANELVEATGISTGRDTYGRQQPSGLFATTQPNSTGNAGDLAIKTNTLLVQNGAQVAAATFGAGKGGNLKVDAQDVQLIGTNANDKIPSGLFVSTQPNSTGDAGDLTIKTNTLLVQNGARVSASTFGSGKGGNLKVDAQDVQLIGTGANSRVNSGLFSIAGPGNSIGNAGDLTIKTNTLLVQNGAQVSAATFGAGKGGNLKVDAQDVQLIGTSADGQIAASGFFANTLPNSTGDAGGLAINTNTLLVRDGARVTVGSLGTGNAGNMTLNARSIRLNNDALLSANTRSTKVDPNREQATININSQDLIMSRNSNIFTNASGENVIGGNINIDTDFLIALENSDINADSANFRGGNVRINTQGILGTQFRDEPTPESDITARGASPEFSGTVNINTLGIEPNSGLINLPTQLVEARVAQTCQPSGNQAQSEFVVTGRGGLPPSPDETLSSDAIQVDWVTLNPKVENRNQGVSTNITTPEPDSIVEATGWTIANNGDVILKASATPALPGNSWQTPAKCHAN